jgi:hypothetical protein
MAAEAAMAEFAAESTQPSYPHTPQDVPDRSWAAFCRSMMEQIHLLQSEIASSRSAEAQLREEILELRTIISVLDAVVCQRAENTPTGEEDSAKKKKKKSKKKLSGGVPNRHKSSGEPGDSTSSEEVTSDEEALRVTSHFAASRGRRVDGLVEQTTRRPEFKSLVSYRTYRLADTTQAVDTVDTGKVNGYLKKFRHHLDYKFSGDPAIQVLDFLATFKEAADLNGVSEGIATLILPYFLEGRAKAGMTAKLKQVAASMPKYPAAVQFLLQSFATETVIAAACQKVFKAKQLPDEDEKMFAGRLTKNAAEAGSVFTEDALISTFVDGLHEYAANMVRAQVTSKMTFAEVQIIAEQIGTAGRALTSPSRFSQRLMPNIPLRSKTSVAAFAESPTSSSMALTGTHFGPATLSPLAIAAVEPSPASEHGSEISIPTRGWASAAGSVQEDPVCALYERNLNCHLCFTPGHFLMDCPFLGAETKQAAQKHRETRLRETPALRALPPGDQMAPPLRPPTRPGGPPRVRDFRRPVVPVHPVEFPEDEPEPLMAEKAEQRAENEAGDA